MRRSEANKSSVWACSDRPLQPLRNRASQASSKADLYPSQDDEGRGTEILKVRQTEIARKGAALDVQSDAWSEPENGAQRELGISIRARLHIETVFRFSIVDIVEASHEIWLNGLGLLAQHRPCVGVGTGSDCAGAQDAGQGESPLFVVDEGTFSENANAGTFYLYA